MAKIIGKKLLYEGFIYLRSKKRGAKTYWDCNRLRRGQCSARAITTMRGDEVIVRVTSSNKLDPDDPDEFFSVHQHPPSHEESRFYAFSNIRI